MLETSANKILQLESDNKRLSKQLAERRVVDDSNSKDTSSVVAKPTETGHADAQTSVNGTTDDADDLKAENGQLKLDLCKLQARLAAAVQTENSAGQLEGGQNETRLVRKTENLQCVIEALESENGRLISELDETSAKTKWWSQVAGGMQLEKQRLERRVRQLEKTVVEAPSVRKRQPIVPLRSKELAASSDDCTQLQ